MLRPSQALQRAAVTGAHLPRVAALAELHEKGIDFRSSQLCMITGRPKAGKSFFAQWLASEWAKAAREQGSECPGIYFFLDGTPFTAAVRQAAWVTGDTTASIAEALEGPGAAYYEDALATVADDIAFVFDKRPELPAIQAEIDAYVELWDRYPSWMVFDNLLNIEGCFEDHRVQKDVLAELQSLAYTTGACIVVLHHASESGVKDYSKAPRVGDTDGKVNQLPEMVLPIAKDPDSDAFRIAVGAVRDGAPSDPNGDRPVVLHSDLSRVQFSRKQAPGPMAHWWDQEVEDGD
jgi:hypothetical protein